MDPGGNAASGAKATATPHPVPLLVPPFGLSSRCPRCVHCESVRQSLGHTISAGRRSRPAMRPSESASHRRAQNRNWRRSLTFDFHQPRVLDDRRLPQRPRHRARLRSGRGDAARVRGPVRRGDPVGVSRRKPKRELRRRVLRALPGRGDAAIYGGCIRTIAAAPSEAHAPHRTGRCSPDPLCAAL